MERCCYRESLGCSRGAPQAESWMASSGLVSGVPGHPAENGDVSWTQGAAACGLTSCLWPQLRELPRIQEEKEDEEEDGEEEEEEEEEEELE